MCQIDVDIVADRVQQRIQRAGHCRLLRHGDRHRGNRAQAAVDDADHHALAAMACRPDLVDPEMLDDILECPVGR